PGGSRDHLGGDAGRGRWPGGGVPARRRQGRGGRGAARAGEKKRTGVGKTGQRRVPSRPSRRRPPRPPRAPRVGGGAQGGGVSAVAEDRPLDVSSSSRSTLLWGPLTAFALAIAVATAAIDQAAKLWLLFSLDLPARGIVRLTPFLDLVLTWNPGISYGLF